MLKGWRKRQSFAEKSVQETRPHEISGGTGRHDAAAVSGKALRKLLLDGKDTGENDAYDCDEQNQTG